jgi:uncharacterized protein (TIGR02186 family)
MAKTCHLKPIAFLLWVLLLLLPLPLAAKPIIADMSDYQIAIDSDFTGKRILIFGARNDPGDVMIVVRGPERDVTVRKKKRVMGIWMNGAQARFRDVPYFYAITGTRPVAELPASHLYRQLGIGLESISLETSASLGDQTLAEFREAYRERQKQLRLYQEFEHPLGFMGATLFKTVMNFPDNLPRGDYSVDVYLLKDGAVQSMHSLPIQVKKVGFDAFVFDAAHRQEWLYGLICVLIAVGFGWVVSFIFAKLW